MEIFILPVLQVQVEKSLVSLFFAISVLIKPYKTHLTPLYIQNFQSPAWNSEN